MDKNTAFSFVMPAYKKRFLYKAIDSILKQNYQDYELIIVNDASPEGLEDVIQQFHDERIRYEINHINIGRHDLIANWNHCIQFANNEYIILASDDDMFETDFLSKASMLISKYPKVDIIRSGVKKIDEHDKILDYEFPMKEYMTSREYTLSYAKGMTISCVSNYVFKKKALNNIGGFIPFPHAHYSDDATVLTLTLNGIACISTNEMNFRMSKSNLSNSWPENPKSLLNITAQFLNPVYIHVMCGKGKWSLGRGLSIYRHLVKYFIKMAGIWDELCKKKPGYCI